MLQQTQVATVIPYYQRFLQRFPDVQSLAAASAAEVMALWSGLGYYSRARNLHRCAQAVVAEHGGCFPTDASTLATLPGIGRSTAAAIAVFAAGAHAAILDGNVKRVLTRAFGIAGFPGERAVEQQLWALAEALLPRTGTEAYTQGLMDLGATVCTRSKPACPQCPWMQHCVALATGRTAELPTRKPRAPVPEKSVTLLVIVDAAEVLLERRPDAGIWGGLLSLPETGTTEPAALAQAAARFGPVAAITPLTPFTHGFTHFKLQASPFLVQLERRAPFAGQGSPGWYWLDQLETLALPAPVKKLLRSLTPVAPE